mmetsp:Transcript_85575/g.261745  ORF Transcript_85575/g.261745 Transcript_85575/m.261745 type:complete len:215 (+) Transcript_85575:1153-1797(+)
MRSSSSARTSEASPRYGVTRSSVSGRPTTTTCICTCCSWCRPCGTNRAAPAGRCPRPRARRAATPRRRPRTGPPPTPRRAPRGMTSPVSSSSGPCVAAASPRHCIGTSLRRPMTESAAPRSTEYGRGSSRSSMRRPRAGASGGCWTARWPCGESFCGACGAPRPRSASAPRRRWSVFGRRCAKSPPGPSCPSIWSEVWTRASLCPWTRVSCCGA